MKNKFIIILVGVLIVLVVLLGGNNRENGTIQKPQDVNVDSKTNSPTSKGGGYPTRTDDQAEVTVEVTPEILGPDKEAIFQITFNTHSVALDQDLAETAVLTDDQGTVYKPTNWSGGSGGHHLSGTLTFPKVSVKAKSVELVILGIAGVERRFKWDF